MSNEGFCPTPLPDAPASARRKTLVEMFEGLRFDLRGVAAGNRGAFLARLREADAALASYDRQLRLALEKEQTLDVALDEARICADADGVRIRELVAERVGLVSLLAVNEAEGETLAGTVRALYEANERGVARYGDVLRERDEARRFAETERNEGHRRCCAQYGYDAERTSKLLFPWEKP